MLPIGEALQLLRFGTLADGDLVVSDTGRQFVAADTDPRKALFGASLRAHVPLVAQIRQVLDERWNHRASAVRFRDELEDKMSPDYAEDTMRAGDHLGPLRRALQLRRGCGPVLPRRGRALGYDRLRQNPLCSVMRPVNARAQRLGAAMNRTPAG